MINPEILWKVAQNVYLTQGPVALTLMSAFGANNNFAFFGNFAFKAEAMEL